VALKLYSDRFEPGMLETTRKCYDAEGDRLMTEMDVPDYLAHVMTRLQEEVRSIGISPRRGSQGDIWGVEKNDRVSLYLEEKSRREIITLVERQLVKKHTAEIIQRGFDRVMEESRKPDAARMYLLLSHVNELEALRKSFGEYLEVGPLCRAGLVENAAAESSNVRKREPRFACHRPSKTNEWCKTCWPSK